MVLREFNIGENYSGVGLAIDLYTDCGKFHLTFDPEVDDEVTKINFSGSLSAIANMVMHPIDKFSLTKLHDDKEAVEITANLHTVIFSPVTLEYIGE